MVGKCGPLEVVPIFLLVDIYLVAGADALLLPMLLLFCRHRYRCCWYHLFVVGQMLQLQMLL